MGKWGQFTAMGQPESAELTADPRFLPAPLTAAEKAAVEAALLASNAPRGATKARVLVGTAALALAVTVPNLSLGAMGSPFFDLADKPSAEAEMDSDPRTSPARAATTVAQRPYIPVAYANEIAPAVATYSSRSNFGEFDRELPLALRSGAQPLDLAAARVEMPIAATAALSASFRNQPVTLAQVADGDRRTPSVFIDQITDRPLVARLAPLRARELQVMLGGNSSIARSEVISEASFEAAFAGVLDTGATAPPGEALVDAPGRNTPQEAPEPRRQSVALAEPLSTRSARVSASAAGQSALAIDLALDEQQDVSAFLPAFPADNPLSPTPLSAAPVRAPVRSEASLAASARSAAVAVVEEGKQAFNLAFEPYMGVRSATVAPSARLPEAPVQRFNAATPARNAHLAQIEQISGRPLVARAAPQESRQVRATLDASSPVARGDAISSELVETAFAGMAGITSEMRGSLSLDGQQRPRLPREVNEAIARAVPIPEPDPDLSANAAAQAALVPKTELDARVNGVLTGSVDFLQLDGTIAVRLRSVVGMLRDRFSSNEFSALLQGDAIDTFVPIAQLQAIGVPISYNPAYDEVEFGIDYKDAPNAKKVQMEQIGAPSIGQERTMIEQIPRPRP